MNGLHPGLPASAADVSGLEDRVRRLEAQVARQGAVLDAVLAPSFWDPVMLVPAGGHPGLLTRLQAARELLTRTENEARIDDGPEEAATMLDRLRRAFEEGK